MGYRKAQFWDHFYSTFFLIDLFLIHSNIDIANFSDDNMPYLSAKDVKDVIESLERASVSLFRWSENSLLKGDAGKCHFLVSTSQEVSLNVNTFKIKKQWLWKTFRRQIWFQNLGLTNILQICVHQLPEKYTH